MRDSVSVIIPVYNSESSIARCIESVLSQTYTNIEIIIINDGSTDRSKQLLAQYVKNDKRVVYYEQDNQGLSATRNYGIDVANSEYITFLDSDDTLEPTFIEEVFVKMINNSADIGLCDIYYVNSVSNQYVISRIRGFESEFSSPISDNTIVNKSRTFAWGKIYKKSIFEKLHFPNINFEDICTTPLAIIAAEKVVCVHKPLISYYRNNLDSISENVRNANDIFMSVLLLRDRLKATNLLKTYLLEYKKILLGQIRFAIQRFPSVNFDGFVNFVETEFPEVTGFAQAKYYVARNDKLLNISMSKCVPYSDFIINDINIADCVILRRHEVIASNKPIVYVDIPNGEITEDIIYDVAEEIMAKLSLTR
jgi:glycosyltransferase involved in cell wall biosynthesis